VTDDIRAEGGIYPDMGDMRKTSAIVAKAVAARAYEAGVAVELPRPRDLLTWAEELQYQPRYKVYR
jgi:malate dehydrogenase (oxaloacetate-decarboxylating)(NADP+)